MTLFQRVVLLALLLLVRRAVGKSTGPMSEWEGHVNEVLKEGIEASLPPKPAPRRWPWVW